MLKFLYIQDVVCLQVMAIAYSCHHFFDTAGFKIRCKKC